MSGPPFVPFLVKWMNWLIPEEPNIENIGEFINSKKLRLALEKILPEEVLPQPDDSLVYVYTIITCMIKANNKGADIFRNPIKYDDNNMNAIFIILQLFILYAISLNGKQPENSDEWYPTLIKVYNNFVIKNPSTITDFPFQTYQMKVEEDNENIKKDLEKLRKQADEMKEVFEKKSESVHEKYQPKIDENIRTLALLEKNKKKKLEKIQNEEERAKKLSEQHSNIKDTEQAYNEELKKNEELEKELQEYRNKEEVFKKAKLELEITEDGEKQRTKITTIEQDIEQLLDDEHNYDREIKETIEQITENSKEKDYSAYEEEIKKYDDEANAIDINERKQKWLSILAEETAKVESETKALITVSDLGRVYIKESKPTN